MLMLLYKSCSLTINGSVVSQKPPTAVDSRNPAWLNRTKLSEVLELQGLSGHTRVSAINRNPHKKNAYNKTIGTL